MIVSFPLSTIVTLPDTGASIMSAPFSRTFAASARLTAGLTVLISMSNFPGPRPASNPFGPSDAPCSAAVLVTMQKVKSAAWQTARPESAHFMPAEMRSCAFSFGKIS